MSDHKRNLNKLKAEIMSGIFSGHNGTKLEINTRRQTDENVNTTYKQHKMSKVFFIACSKFEPKIKEKKDK